jgi:hypothetical protein
MCRCICVGVHVPVCAFVGERRNKYALKLNQDACRMQNGGFHEGSCLLIQVFAKAKKKKKRTRRWARATV